jgi:cell division protein FtsQ
MARDERKLTSSRERVNARRKARSSNSTNSARPQKQRTQQVPPPRSAAQREPLRAQRASSPSSLKPRAEKLGALPRTSASSSVRSRPPEPRRAAAGQQFSLGAPVDLWQRVRRARRERIRRERAERPAERPQARGPRFQDMRHEVDVKAANSSPPRAVKRVRAAARERSRRTQNPGSQVRPGLGHTLLAWLANGRLCSLLLFMASLAALLYLFASPRFRVQQIDVQGNSVLQSEAVASLSGLHDASIWFVDYAQVNERLLQNAYVEHTSVQISLPDRAVISVTERRPEVRWEVNGVQYLVDGSGRVLAAAQEPAEPGTLIIVGSAQQALQPMEHVDTNAMELGRALALRLPTELGIDPLMIGWDIGLGVYIRTHGSQTIVFGQTDNLDRKLAVLGYLLENDTQFTYLDLRPENPFFRTDG